MGKAFLRAFMLLTIVVSGCGLEPSGGIWRPETRGGVTMFLEHASLGLVRSTVKSCRINVYPVVDGRLGAIEGGERTWPVDPESERSEFTVDGLSLGVKEFHALLLDEAGSTLGEGKVRYEVVPGAQTLEPLVINLVDPPDRRRSVPVEVRVTSRARETPLTYQDVKPVFENCVGCHNNDYLNLTSFPFKSYANGSDQAAIVSDVLGRMRRTGEGVMPPTGALPADTIAMIQRWLDGGLQAAATSDTVDPVGRVELRWRATSADDWTTIRLAAADDQEGMYVGEIDNARVGHTYECKVTVLDANGGVLHEAPIASFRIAATGGLEQHVDFEYERPRVRVPIIIEP